MRSRSPPQLLSLRALVPSQEHTRNGNFIHHGNCCVIPHQGFIKPFHSVSLKASCADEKKEEDASRARSNSRRESVSASETKNGRFTSFELNKYIHPLVLMSHFSSLKQRMAVFRVFPLFTHSHMKILFRSAIWQTAEAQLLCFLSGELPVLIQTLLFSTAHFYSTPAFMTAANKYLVFILTSMKKEGVWPYLRGLLSSNGGMMTTLTVTDVLSRSIICS